MLASGYYKHLDQYNDGIATLPDIKKMTLWSRCRPALIALCMLWLMLCVNLHAHAAAVEVSQARIEASDDGYRLAANYSLDLSEGLKKALGEGLPVTFTAEVEISRARWYWVDEKVSKVEQTIRIAYNEWTQQYAVTINNGLQQNFSSLDAAMSLVLRPGRWLVADKNQLGNGKNYTIAVRLRMGISQLPKHFQISAFNDHNLRQISEWKRFSYKVEDK